MNEFLSTLSKTDLLTPEEEMELAKKVEMGDVSARNTLVERNLRLVISIAKRYMGCGVPFEDLVQEGIGGLLKATERFDWRRGTRFASVAQIWINQAIMSSLQQSKTIRIPSNVYQLQSRARQMCSTSEGIEEVAKTLGVSETYLKSVIKNIDNILSLETPIGDDTTFAEFIVDETAQTFDDAVRQLLTEEIDKILSKLDSRSRYIIVRRFGLDKKPRESLETIGKSLGITRERVRQIEAETLKKLQSDPKLAHLRDYL